MTCPQSEDDGFRLGVLMLETRFPRLPGDIGNPGTFDFPVSYHRVPAATVARIATPEAHPIPPALVEAFTEGARALAAGKVSLISTSCGFLLPLQTILERVSGCAVITSALALLPALRARHGPDAVIGIATFDTATLGKMALAEYGPMAVAGLEPSGVLYRAISEDHDRLDADLARRETVAAALSLVERKPAPVALILECTNLGPYRADIVEATGLPVHDITTAINRHRARQTLRLTRRA